MKNDVPFVELIKFAKRSKIGKICFFQVLEMSKLVIQRMQDTNESMSGEEINAFLPYLLQKLGEPKDAMRQAARFEFFCGNY